MCRKKRLYIVKTTQLSFYFVILFFLKQQMKTALNNSFQKKKQVMDIEGTLNTKLCTNYLRISYSLQTPMDW